MSGAELRMWCGLVAALVVAVGPPSPRASLSRSFCSYKLVSNPSESLSSSLPPALPPAGRSVEADGTALARAAAAGDVDVDRMAVLTRAAAAGETAAGLSCGPLQTRRSR